MAKFRKNVYCEKQFLRILASKIEENNSSIEYEELKVWKSIDAFLYKSSITLHLDMSNDEYESFYVEIEEKYRNSNSLDSFDIYFRRLYQSQRSEQDKLCIEYDNISINEKVEDEHLHRDAIYLSMCNSEVCKFLGAKGILVISPNNISSYTPLLNDCGYSIKQNDKGPWEKYLHKCKHVPCSSITIIDNYLLNKTDKIEPVLGDILKSLLPQEADNSFPIIICSSFSEGSGMHRKDLPFEERWEEVVKLVKSIERPYSFSLCVIKCADKTFHDRTIITNNLWISCGAGFCLFGENNKAINTTVVNIVSPYLNDRIKWAFRAYGYLTNAVKKLNSCESYESLKKKNPRVISFPVFKKEMTISKHIDNIDK